MLALIIGALWWMAESKFKEEFLPYLKWPLLAIAVIFVLFDAFMFVETSRLIDAQTCCCCDDGDYESGNSTCDTATCCKKYIQDYEYEAENLTVMLGNELSGNVTSSYKAYDGNVHISEANSDGLLIYADYIVSDAPDTASYRVRYNGSGQMTLYVDYYGNLTQLSAVTLGNAWVVNSAAVPNMPNQTIRLIWNATNFDIGETFEIDWQVLDGETTHTMYCVDDMDTAAIFAYHYTEYSVIPLFTGMLPYLGIIAIFGFLAQLMVWLWLGYERRRRGEK